MDKQRAFFINLSYILMTISPTIILSFGINVKINLVVKVLIIFMISLLVAYLIHHKYLSYGILLLSTLILVGVFWIYPSLLDSFKDKFFDLINNLINNLLGNENISRDNKVFIWIISSFFIALINALIIFKIRKKAILLIYMPLFLIYWYNFYDQAFPLMVLFVFSFFLLNYDSKPEYLKIIFYFSLLIVSLALVLPKTSNYVSLDYVDEKVDLLFPNIKKLRSAESEKKNAKNAPYFDFSKTGFQQDPSRLGGPVVLDNKPLMEIRGDNVDYLRGNIRHTYTGSLWESELVNYKNVLNLEKVWNVSKEEIDLYRELGFSVKNLNFPSTTIFTPLYPLYINIGEGSSFLVNKDFSIIYTKGIYENDSYFVKSLINRAYGIQVDRGVDKSKEDLDNLDLYLQVPDSITNRTKLLTREIVGGLEKDIDKAVAIEDYLRKNYVYDTGPPFPPDGADFIDHFLFNEKGGYCTYFASAMTIMLRLENIPARYVEGFLVGPKGEDSIQTVYNNNAHTWVEAFIEPVGWTIFEPTPAYELRGRLVGFSPLTDIETTSPGDGKSRDPEDAGGREINSPYLEGSLDGIFETKDKSIPFLYFKLFLALLGFFITLRVLQLIYKNNKNKKEYFAFNKTNKILYLYNNIVNTIENLGYKKDPSETHFEFLDRVIYKFYDGDKFSFKEATSIFVKSKYGSYCPTDDEIIEMEAYLKSLDEKLKIHLGPFRYFLQKWKIK